MSSEHPQWMRNEPLNSPPSPKAGESRSAWRENENENTSLNLRMIHTGEFNMEWSFSVHFTQ